MGSNFRLKKSFIYIFLTAAILTGGWFLSARLAYGESQLKSVLKEVAEKLVSGDVHALVVCDKGMLKGIVSTADIMKYLLVNDRKKQPN